jgi:hypothetical protein
LHADRTKFVQKVMRGGNGDIKRLIRRYKNRHAKKSGGVKTTHPLKLAAEFAAIGAKSAVFRCGARPDSTGLHRRLPSRSRTPAFQGARPTSNRSGHDVGPGGSWQEFLILNEFASGSVEAALKKLLAFLRV